MDETDAGKSVRTEDETAVQTVEAPSTPGKSTRGKVVSGFLWRFAERISEQVVQFVVSVVLARVLAPEAFGTISLVLVFTQVLQVFVDSGVGTALIQKKNADDVDFSSVFYFNLLWCSLVYAVAFFAAPAVGAFYNNDSLIPITRVLAVTILISGVRNVQQAYVSRTMQFRRFFWSTLSGTVISGVVGIAMALMGYGVWSLVFQQVLNVGIATAVLWFTVRWRPIKAFSLERLKGLVSFGWKLLVSGLIDAVYNNVRQLLIGKLYTEADLAFYNRGQQVPTLVVINVNNSLDSVLLPVMSRVQDDIESLLAMCRRSMAVNTYVVAPLMMGVTFCAEPLVSLVFTDKWLPCVPYLRIFCIAFTLSPLQTITVDVVKALGRSDLYLKLEIIKKIIGFSLLLATMHMGVLAMAYSLLVNNLITQGINVWCNRRLINYRFTQQMADISPSIVLAVVMGFAVLPIMQLPLPTFVILALQFFLGAGFYLGMSLLLKLEAFSYLKDMVLSFAGKMRGMS